MLFVSSLLPSRWRHTTASDISLVVTKYICLMFLTVSVNFMSPQLGHDAPILGQILFWMFLRMSLKKKKLRIYLYNFRRESERGKNGQRDRGGESSRIRPAECRT